MIKTTTVAEGIAALKALEDVVSVRFEGIDKLPEYQISTSGDPPTTTEVIQPWSIITVRVLRIKGSEAMEEFVRAVCYDFGGTEEAVYLIVEEWSE